MTQISQSHSDVKNAGWTCIQLDTIKVWEARKHDSYYEFFETAHIRHKYAIYSVPDGYDFFFCNEVDAAAFALRWS